MYRDKMEGVLRGRPRRRLNPYAVFQVFMLSFLTASELITLSETCKVYNEDEEMKRLILSRFKLSLRDICLKELRMDDNLFLSIFEVEDFRGVLSGSTLLSALHHKVWFDFDRRRHEINIYVHKDNIPLWNNLLSPPYFRKFEAMSELNNMLDREMSTHQSKGDFTDTHTHTHVHTHTHTHTHVHTHTHTQSHTYTETHTYPY